MTTDTSTVPEPGGATAVIEVEDRTCTEVAGNEPTVTPALAEKPLPRIVRTVPPATEPLLGAIFAIAGLAGTGCTSAGGIGESKGK